MINIWDESFAAVLLVGGLSAAGLLLTAWYLSRQRPALPRISKLHRDQRGGAYTLNFTLALFCLFLFVCVIVECGQLFLAHTGTVYSAFAAVRTAIVHSHHADRDQMAERAAVQAFVPFSRGLEKYDPEPNDGSDESTLWEAYQSLTDRPVSQKYFRNKELSAGRRVKVLIDDLEPDDPAGPLEVKVTYRYPLMFPFLGVALGTREGAEYYRNLTATVTLPKESPHSENQQLGIDYDGD